MASASLNGLGGAPLSSVGSSDCRYGDGDESVSQLVASVYDDGGDGRECLR
jgi:hypothetical protein